MRSPACCRRCPAGSRPQARAGSPWRGSGRPARCGRLARCGRPAARPGAGNGPSGRPMPGGRGQRPRDLLRRTRLRLAGRAAAVPLPGFGPGPVVSPSGRSPGAPGWPPSGAVLGSRSPGSLAVAGSRAGWGPRPAPGRRGGPGLAMVPGAAAGPLLRSGPPLRSGAASGGRLAGGAGTGERPGPAGRAGGRAVLARGPGAGRPAAAFSSAAASWCGWGRDTSRARIAALTVTFIPGMAASPPSVARWRVPGPGPAGAPTRPGPARWCAAARDRRGRPSW